MSKMKDIINEQVAAKNAVAAIPTVDVSGATVDLLGYQTCLFTAYVGTSLDTLSGSLYIELEVEESDNNSDWSDVDDSDLSDYVAGTNDGCWAFIDAAAEDDVVVQTQYKGSKRYCRAVINVTGTHTNGTPITVISQKFGADVAPAV